MIKNKIEQQKLSNKNMDHQYSLLAYIFTTQVTPEFRIGTQMNRDHIQIKEIMRV